MEYSINYNNKTYSCESLEYSELRDLIDECERTEHAEVTSEELLEKYYSYASYEYYGYYGFEKEEDEHYSLLFILVTDDNSRNAFIKLDKSEIRNWFLDFYKEDEE